MSKIVSQRGTRVVPTPREAGMSELVTPIVSFPPFND